ncbi:MAG: hypothetical protein JW917_07535 [Ignavibacteria bacterium]|nr:hypothetical protein [Ignavibacteria bacterium]
MKPFLLELDYSTLEKRISNLSLFIDLNKHKSYDYTSLKEYKELLLFLKRKPKIFNMFEHLIYDYDYIYFNTQKLIIELIRTKRELLQDKTDIEIKFLFEKDLIKVKENNNIYMILFAYMDYIKENILRDKLGYPDKKKIPDIRVFEYIADVIYTTSIDKDKKKLVERVKGYYNHTYKYLKN